MSETEPTTPEKTTVKKTIVVNVTPELWAAIKVASFKANSTPSKVAAQLLEDFVNA